MKILFLCSGAGSCRSLIAKTILESIDDRLEVFAAGTAPVSELNPVAFEVMKFFGYPMASEEIRPLDDFKTMELEYVITLCDGTKEEFDRLSLTYRKKLHLGFADPGKITGSSSDQIKAYKSYIEEIKTELDYFYHRILKKEKAAE
ncbi:hypothetical protein [Gaoshiqia sediminis]|uniref:Phosphotyrosine protein phosphatase I domain-containing protein n=1 Tax=Gaoshiqia sediminis TaxID=2986998 RepID=A0AA41Y6L6_9BACT|nr:hypothetical protein [Gaoshiqia sediminis]MCW0484386.1 hypothetical protein [Gaoshiqia sediminis]